MGYHADNAMIESWGEEFRLDAINKELSRQAEDILEEYMMGIAVWETKDGDDIMVVEMTDLHIKNSFEFMNAKKEKNATTLAWIKVFKAEIIKRKI